MRGCGTIFLIAYLALLGFCITIYGPVVILEAIIGFCAGYLFAALVGAFLRRKS
jgi:hypothetical protein